MTYKWKKVYSRGDCSLLYVGRLVLLQCVLSFFLYAHCYDCLTPKSDCLSHETQTPKPSLLNIDRYFRKTQKEPNNRMMLSISFIILIQGLTKLTWVMSFHTSTWRNSLSVISFMTSPKMSDPPKRLARRDLKKVCFMKITVTFLFVDLAILYYFSSCNRNEVGMVHLKR